MKFLGNILLTSLGAAIVFGVCWAMNGFEMPSLDRFTFSLAFYALFVAIESKNIFGAKDS